MAKKLSWTFKFKKKVDFWSYEWTGITASTPFFRRFVNERLKEAKDLKKLFIRVTDLHAQAGIDVPRVALGIMEKIGASIYDSEDIWDCVRELISQCDELYPPFEPNWETLSIEIAAEVKNSLYTQEAFLKKKLVPVIVNTIVNSLQATNVPTGTGLFTAPLYTFDGDMVKNVIRPFYSDDVLDNYLFLTIRGIFRSHFEDEQLPDPLTVDFLKDTPLYELLQKPQPLDIPEDTFFSHLYCLGGSGSGKTTFLIQLMIHHFESDATVIFIDSQGDVIPKLRTLEAIQDRIVYVDPRKPPRIDLFKNATVETVSYLFSMLGTDLTGKQAIFFRMCAHLLMKIEHATLLDFLKMMDDLGPYERYIEKLSEIQRDFFHKDFKSKNFSQTREQVKYRLHGILENDTILRLFTGRGTPIDLGDNMDSGSIILIDTSKEYLKSASPYFGRIFVACILQEVYARAKKKRHPTYLIIDEAHEYLDSNIDEFLTQARKYKCGVVLAHQSLSQATSELRASLSANTAIKMVAGVSISDARALAPDMRTTPDYIMSLPRLTFATYIRNVTTNAIPFKVTVGLLDQQEHVELPGIYENEEIEEIPDEVAEPQEVRTEPEEVPPQETPYDNVDTSASENW